MKTENPKEFWNVVSKKKNWREYILPKRNDNDFFEEGKKEASAISSVIDKPKTILEYGCGIGRILRYMNAERKIGVDICEDYIKKAKSDKTSEYYLLDEFIKRNEKVDFIYCISVMQHNTEKERDKIIQNMKSLLNKDGVVYVSFPHEKSTIYKEGEFIHVFTKKEIKRYGDMFSSYKILEGNLVNYADGNKCEYNEYYLLAKL